VARVRQQGEAYIRVNGRIRESLTPCDGTLHSLRAICSLVSPVCHTQVWRRSQLGPERKALAFERTRRRARGFSYPVLGCESPVHHLDPGGYGWCEDPKHWEYDRRHDRVLRRIHRYTRRAASRPGTTVGAVILRQVLLCRLTVRPFTDGLLCSQAKG
jgi:hypothetical protein